MRKGLKGRIYLVAGLLLVVLPVFLVAELVETVRWWRWRKRG